MKLKLLFALLIVTVSNAQTQIGQDIALNANNLDAIALSENGNILAVSSGSVTQVYSNISGNWVQVGQDIQGYGYRIMLSNNGSVLAVTSYGNTVRVYENINNNWTQIGKDISEKGHDIALSGDGSVLAIADDFGPVNIYKNISGTWTTIGNLNVFAGFSICLSENGDTIATAPHPGTTIDVFKNFNNTWIPVGNTINANPNDGSTGFRMDISSDGNTIAVTAGSTQPQNTGSVKVYRYISNTWTQIGNPITSQVSNEHFGTNVAISGSGNVVIVGAYDKSNFKNGRVDIFEYLQSNWVKKGEVIDNNGNSIYWAIAVSRDGSSLALRSNGKVGPKPAAGSNEGKGPSAGVRVYDISGILSSDTFVLENFNIYPNPTTDILNIELKENLSLEKVLIYNTSGQLIKETTEKTINVSGFAKGIYNVQVLTDQGKATKKIIVK